MSGYIPPDTQTVPCPGCGEPVERVLDPLAFCPRLRSIPGRIVHFPVIHRIEATPEPPDSIGCFAAHDYDLDRCEWLT